MSLESGLFPDNWKHADVRPRLKKPGLELVFKNLRPISNLSFASKLTERAVFNQTHNHLAAHKLYPKAQSSYREFHSTETALLRVKHDILMNMNQQHVTLLVLLDLSAMFDTVDPDILLERLQSSFGISGSVLEDHLNVHAYADDSQLYTSFKPDAGAHQSAAVTAMQNCIDDVKRWMLADKLKLNKDKTEFILIGTRQPQHLARR